MRKKVYWANSIFSEADRYYNLKCAKYIRSKGFEVFLPQETAFNNPENNEITLDSEIFTKDTSNILESDIMVACIDQETIDCGVACEIGIAYSAGIPVVGLYTDFRQNRKGEYKMYKNPYVIGVIKMNGEITSELKIIDKILLKHINKSQINESKNLHIKHFSDVSEKYSKFVKKLENNYIPKWNIKKILYEHLKMYKPKYVLDFGCGDGRMLEHLSRISPKTKFIGFDNSKFMISIANKRKIRNTNFTNSWNYLRKSIKKSSIDFIMILFSLHDNNNQLNIFKKLLNLVKKEGHLLIIDLMKDDLPFLTNFLIKKMALPLISYDYRLDATKISTFIESTRTEIKSSKIHIPRVYFSDQHFLLEYINIFGLSKGMDLPLGPDRSEIHKFHDFSLLINNLRYPFIDQRVFGEFLIKKI